MSSTLNDVPEITRKAMCQMLNLTLAEITDLSSQLQNAHWNVKGPWFSMFHSLFGDLYGTISGQADVIAERCVQLGGIAKGTIQEAAADSGLSLYPPGVVSGQALAQEMILRVNELASQSRKFTDAAAAAGDQATSQLFIDLVLVLDKALWFLESHSVD